MVQWTLEVPDCTPCEEPLWLAWGGGVGVVEEVEARNVVAEVEA